MQKNYAEEYIKKCLKETINKISPAVSSPSIISLILKRINSQINFDPFFSEEFFGHEPDNAKIDNYLNNFVLNYLSPSLKSINDPFLMKDMDKAVNRIVKALIGNENICIYGDYDVDGITSTAFLVSFLREVKKLIGEEKNENNIFYKLPNRIKDGYGLGIEPIEEIFDSVSKVSLKPLTLIITVDLGITNVDEVAYANSKNIDVIICDHHEIPVNKNRTGGNSDEPSEILPDAHAILNPKRRGDKFPFKVLPGVGIAFNLGIGLRKRLVTDGLINISADEVQRKLNLKDYLDIVCLGIIADIVPMYSDNRTLTYFGLKKINDNPSPGIKELRRICGLHFDNINESDVAWKIAPKINAAGRVSDPAIAVELLIQKDPEKAYCLAQELDAANRKRQALEDICFNDAIAKLNENNLNQSRDPLLILYGESWHPGVIGIVSSKLVEYLQKPVLLLSGIKENVYIGSARSHGDIDIYTYLKDYESFFDKFGGHKMACGVTIKKGRNFNEFIALTSKNFASALAAETDANGDNINDAAGNIVKTVSYDEEININAIIKKDLNNLIKLISPCGPLNEQPKFLLRDVILSNINKKAFKNKNINSKKTGSFNCYFTLNIECSLNAGNIRPKAFLFNKHKAMETMLGADNIVSKDVFKERIAVNGIIFEFFNGYIKILSFI